MPFDFNAPQFSTATLLRVVGDLSHETYKQWVHRGVVTLSSGRGVGARGRQAIHRGTDVVQVACKHEMARIGFMPSKVDFVWGVVRGRMLARQFPSPVDRGPVTAILHPDEHGQLCGRIYSEASDDADLDNPAAPSAFMVYRVDRWLDVMVQRMQAELAKQAA